MLAVLSFHFFGTANKIYVVDGYIMSAAKHSICAASLPLFAGEERIVIIFRHAKEYNVSAAKFHYIKCNNNEFDCNCAE